MIYALSSQGTATRCSRDGQAVCQSSCRGPWEVCFRVSCPRTDHVLHAMAHDAIPDGFRMRVKRPPKLAQLEVRICMPDQR